jgi:hypothetical protein
VGTGAGTIPVAAKADGAGTALRTAAEAVLGAAVGAAMRAAAEATYKPSTGTLTLTVNQAQAVSGMIPLAANVPPAGAFTLTVDTADTVTFAVSGSTATAATTKITVSDTRNTYPGWSVTGQDTTWSGSGTANGSTIPGDQLGWTPTSSGTLPQGVALGSPVSPVSPGLGSIPAVLASAPSGNGNGYGTTSLGANLTLTIPVTQQPGPYAGSLVISAVAANP